MPSRYSSVWLQAIPILHSRPFAGVRFPFPTLQADRWEEVIGTFGKGHHVAPREHRPMYFRLVRLAGDDLLSSQLREWVTRSVTEKITMVANWANDHPRDLPDHFTDLEHRRPNLERFFVWRVIGGS